MRSRCGRKYEWHVVRGPGIDLSTSQAVQWNRTPARHVYRAPGTFGLDKYGMFRALLQPLLLAAGLVATGPAWSQPDVLTDEFAGLSAKERARIAREEQENATKDPVYQGLMSTAEALFRTQDYEGALATYQEARKLRPYNVYPKVKIQDLQALIAKRDEMAEQQTVPVVPTPVTTQEPPRVESTPAPVLNKVSVTAPVPEPVIEPAPAKDPPALPRPVRVERAQPPLPTRSSAEPPSSEEEGERIYKEGRSIVVETRVAEEGRIILFRKVSHPWGEEHYFREGLPISERNYKASLGR